jgi:coenzyme F420-reducing hydrogenase beta subunit
MEKYFIGYSLDKEIQYAASSGGIGSSLLKYLFDTKRIGTAVSFDFEINRLIYKPKLIYSFSDYKITASIYHDIDIVKFISDQVSNIIGEIALFCLPCQVKSLQCIFKKHNIDAFIIGLVCSGQQSIDATYFYLKRLNIERKDVLSLQYRGNGWPSGIQIKFKNGEARFIENWTKPWSDIFDSFLFFPRRCFLCKESISSISDIAIADPWLDQYKNDEIGNTLVQLNTIKGQQILNDLKEKKYINLDSISEIDFLTSQYVSIRRKQIFNRNKVVIRKCALLYNNKLYKKLASTNRLFFLLHCISWRTIRKVTFKKL